jgi:ethanolamine utilization protein EutJ
MSNQTVLSLEECNAQIAKFEDCVRHPKKSLSSVYYTGVDLGTACIVLVVLDENREIVAGAYQYANVVRDGMVVDYFGAIQIVRELKEKLEDQLDTELYYGASAIPPGTEMLDSGAIKSVLQGAGFELTNLLDEPTAANQLLNIQNGAIVDIGGGTTGISILKDGKVVKVADEATGGTHFSLVVSGAYGMSYADAEHYKREQANHSELLAVLKSVIEKIAAIINRQIEGYDIDALYLVGGTCCLEGIETIIEKATGIPTYKPYNPMFATPIGIALSCTDREIDE